MPKEPAWEQVFLFSSKRFSILFLPDFLFLTNSIIYALVYGYIQKYLVVSRDLLPSRVFLRFSKRLVLPLNLLEISVRYHFLSVLICFHFLLRFFLHSCHTSSTPFPSMKSVEKINHRNHSSWCRTEDLLCWIYSLWKSWKLYHWKWGGSSFGYLWPESPAASLYSPSLWLSKTSFRMLWIFLLMAVTLDHMP